MVVAFGVRASACGFGIDRAHVRVGKRVRKLAHPARKYAVCRRAPCGTLRRGVDKKVPGRKRHGFQRVETVCSVMAVNLHARRNGQVCGKGGLHAEAHRADGRLFGKTGHAHQFPQHVKHGGLGIAHKILFRRLLNTHADKVFPVGYQVDEQPLRLRGVQRAPGQFFIFPDT